MLSEFIYSSWPSQWWACYCFSGSQMSTYLPGSTGLDLRSLRLSTPSFPDDGIKKDLKAATGTCEKSKVSFGPSSDFMKGSLPYKIGKDGVSQGFSHDRWCEISDTREGCVKVQAHLAGHRQAKGCWRGQKHVLPGRWWGSARCCCHLAFCPIICSQPSDSHTGTAQFCSLKM